MAREQLAGGRFSGSIERAIANLLDGFNYVEKTSARSTEIIVFGRRGEVAIPPPVPKPASILSRWR